MQRPYQFYLSLAILIYCSKYFSLAEPLQGHNIKAVNPSEFPFIVSIGLKLPNVFFSRFHLCTGTLISQKHVLTAAHCLENIRKRDIDVIVGFANLRLAGCIRHNVHSWLTYKEWYRLNNNLPSTNNHDDIAAIQLSSRVNRIVPVNITDLNNVQLYGKSAVTAGWGITNEGQRSSVLQKATVKVLPKKECENRYKLLTNRKRNLDGKMLCTAANPYTLLSGGDSGGPLLDKNNALIGVNRSKCPRRNWGNFTTDFVNKYKFNCHSSVHSYRDFIKAILKT